MTLRLPVIKQQWCLEAIDTHYKNSLSRDRLRTQKSSSNSPYAGQQDVSASASYSQPPAQGSDAKPPPQAAAAAAGAAAAGATAGNDSFRSLERKLEREREKRTRGETPATRLEPKGLTFRGLGLHVPLGTPAHSASTTSASTTSSSLLGPVRNTRPLPSPVLPEETAPASMDIRRNGYRLSSNGRSPGGAAGLGRPDQPPPSAAPSSVTSTAPAVAASLGGNGGGFRTTSNRDALASMGSLTVASTPSSAALRGRSIGFGSREAGASLRSPTQRGKVRGGTVMPLAVGDKAKNVRYSFLDPVPSASPSFQQRLSELAALESDTIRYERTKRIKKRSKQESQ